MNKKVIIIPVLIFVVFIFAGAFFFLRGVNPELKKNSVTIKNQTFEVEVADTVLSRSRGLSGRNGLGDHKRMLFIFNGTSSSGFWMKDMKFPIDIIWMQEGRVIGFSENLPAEPGKSMFKLPIYYPPAPIDRVLEVGAGTVKKYDILENDYVQFGL